MSWVYCLVKLDHVQHIEVNDFVEIIPSFPGEMWMGHI
jgi:hypothetical protein